MGNREECVFACRKLRELLEEDDRVIARCMQGELLEVYRENLREEIRKVQLMERETSSLQ